MAGPELPKYTSTMNGYMQDDRAFDPSGIDRPDPSLLQYYTIMSLFTLIAFPVVWLVHFVKYKTLRYRFDNDGVSMSWGFLFRREINLTYRRIQDIHVTRNILQRWMGLATVSVQTASGSAKPEMQIEGILEYEALRDFLYQQMRGAKERSIPQVSADSSLQNSDHDQALELLVDIRDALQTLARQRGADNVADGDAS